MSRPTLLMLLLIGLALAACGQEASRPGSPSAAGETSAPRPVRTAAVQPSTHETRTTPGVVEARQRAVLSARVPASVTALPYREGEAVVRGAVVARLDDAALRAALVAAEASLKAAEADLLRAERLRQKGAATPREHEEVVARTEAARAQRAATFDALSHAELRAPFAGRIAARPAHVGDVVRPGAAVVEIEGDGGFEVRATIDVGQATSLRPGDTLQALVDGIADPLVATVRSLSPSGDAATHRFEIKADLPRTAALRAGVFARLVLPAAPESALLTIPAAAAFERGGLSGVFVVRDGRAHLRFVALGSRAGEIVEVRAGLFEGERVALAPAGLTDGAAVVEEGR